MPPCLRALAAVVVLTSSTWLLGQQNAASVQAGNDNLPSAATGSSQTLVPHLIRYNGTLRNSEGQPVTGTVGVTFTLYQDQLGGAALWQETQNVALDAQGRYTVLLGASSAEGVPAEVFSSNQARWLGIQAAGQAEQRVLLVSVPYALSADSANSLRGLPLAAFAINPQYAAQAKELDSGATAVTAGAVANTITGTMNYIPVFTDNAGDQGNSLLYQSPQSNGQTYLGFNTTTPQYNFQLVVAGESWAYGGFSMVPAFSGGSNWNTLYGNGGSGFSLIGTALNLGYPASRLDMGANATINLQTGNGTTTPTSRVFVTAAGNVGIGTLTPGSTLEVAGNVMVDGTITGNGSGLTNLNAATLTSGMVPQSALSGVNGSGLTNLTAANITGTLPSATLPANVALVNLSNAFSVPQAVSAAPGGTGAALAVAATGTTGVNGLSATTNDPAGLGALFTNTGSVSSPGRAYILEAVDSTGNYGFRVNANGLESTVPLAQRLSNDSTGTTLNTLVRFTNSGTVATVPTNSGFSATGATGAIGVVVADAGGSGTKSTVAFTGLASCLFDNTTPTIVGDYVVPSVTAVSSTATAGYCHDSGQNSVSALPSYPLPGVQIVGRVVSSNNGVGTCTSGGGCEDTAAQVFLYGFETRAIGGVYGNSFTGQTAAVPATTLFTPLVAGLFRVNVYIVQTAGTCSPQPCVDGVVSFQDETQAQSLNFVQVLGPIGGFSENSAVIHAVPGEPITFSTIYNATAGGVTYNAYVTVDRLM